MDRERNGGREGGRQSSMSDMTTDGTTAQHLTPASRHTYTKGRHPVRAILSLLCTLRDLCLQTSKFIFGKEKNHLFSHNNSFQFNAC